MASQNNTKTNNSPMKGHAPTTQDVAKRVAGGKETSTGTSHPAFQQTLSVVSMVVYGLIFMVPVAPFAIYGNVFQLSNGMPAIAYLIAMVAMIFTVFSFGVMVRKFPSSGSIYTYATESISKGFGFVTGWLMLLQYLITPMLMYIMAGQALNQYLPQVPVWGWCLVFTAFVTIVSTRKLGATIIVDRVALVGQLIVLAMFIFFGVTYVIGHPQTASFTPTAFFDPSKFTVDSTMSAVSLCVFSFVGFGSIATLTQEAKNMKTGPFHAMLVTVLLLGAMFVVMCLLATWIDPTGQSFQNNANNGFYVVAGLCGGEWFGVLCAVTNALALGVFSGLAGQTSVSRVMYVMGTSGALPKWFGKMDKSDVPLRATLFVSALSLAVMVPMLIIGTDNVAKCSNFGALSTYMIVNLCVIVLYWFRLKDHSNPIRYLIFPLIGVVVIGYIFISLNWISHIVGVVWIAIGVAYYLISTKVFHREIKMG